MAYEAVAAKLGVAPRELEEDSLRLYLRHRLRVVESQLLDLQRRYGVDTIAALDALVRSGKLHEAETFEDYFELDRLEAERERLTSALAELE